LLLLLLLPLPLLLLLPLPLPLLFWLSFRGAAEEPASRTTESPEGPPP